MVVGACLADQPLPSSTLSSTTTTSPLHLVNLKVVEAGDDFCASTLPLLQVNLLVIPTSWRRASVEPYSIFDPPVTLWSS